MGTITYNCDGFIAVSMMEKGMQSPAILQLHHGTIRVKHPDDPRLNIVIQMEGHGDRFGIAFRIVVGAASSRSVDMAPVGLLLRMFKWIAVHFTCGSKQIACSLGFCQDECFMSTQ